MAENSRQTFFIPGPLPGLNELVNAAKGRYGRHEYTRMKNECEEKVILFAHAIHPVAIVRFQFHWMEKDKRRDLDNISAGGRKIILDALVRGGKIPGDGWKNVRGWNDEFGVSKTAPGVYVTIIDIETLVSSSFPRPLKGENDVPD